jgi:hypothetical protein
MFFEYQVDGAWVSSAHGDDGANRRHYEVALQAGALRIYNFWGPNPYTDAMSVQSVDYDATPGAAYWLYLTETRVDDAIDGDVTIDGQLLDAELNELAATFVRDDGQLVVGQAVIPSSNKRGFGAYSPGDGTGPKIFAWHVEPAP